MSIPDLVEFDPRYKDRLLSIDDPKSIPKKWQGTPIESLILSENFGVPIGACEQPQLMIATCIEFRYALPVPRMYAYVMRRASGRLVGSEFSVAYAIARGVRHLALIGHNDCGMTKVAENAASMADALVAEGWNPERAKEYISYQSARYAIDDEIDSLEHEYKRLKRLFKRLEIAPLFVCLANTKLYIPKWYQQYSDQNTAKEVSDEDLLTIY